MSSIGVGVPKKPQHLSSSHSLSLSGVRMQSPARGSLIWFELIGQEECAGTTVSSRVPMMKRSGVVPVLNVLASA